MQFTGSVHVYKQTKWNREGEWWTVESECRDYDREVGEGSQGAEVRSLWSNLGNMWDHWGLQEAVQERNLRVAEQSTNSLIRLPFNWSLQQVTQY